MQVQGFTWGVRGAAVIFLRRGPNVLVQPDGRGGSDFSEFCALK